MLALHRSEHARAWKGTAVALSFVATEPLEAIAQPVRPVSAEVRGPIDEAFGRSLFVRDPDGIILQINEHDTELYS